MLLEVHVYRKCASSRSRQAPFEVSRRSPIEGIYIKETERTIFLKKKSILQEGSYFKGKITVHTIARTLLYKMILSHICNIARTIDPTNLPLRPIANSSQKYSRYSSSCLDYAYPWFTFYNADPRMMEQVDGIALLCAAGAYWNRSFGYALCPVPCAQVCG